MRGSGRIEVEMRPRCGMIARMWRGATRSQDAEAYAAYVSGTGIDAYRGTPGNLGALLLQRPAGDLTEVVTISLWDSIGSITAFAGEDVERAVFYPEDDRYLVERDPEARHYLVADFRLPAATTIGGPESPLGPAEGGPAE